MFTGLRGRITLSASTYGTLWDYDSRGPQHPTLFVDTPIRYGPELEAAEQAAMRELHAAGLLHRGLPHPDLREALALIAEPEREYYGWLGTGPDKMFGLLVAVRGNIAVRALSDGKRVRLEPADAHQPTHHLLAVLPRVRKATGRSINAREDAVAPVSPPVGAPRPQGVQLAELMRAERTGRAELNVAIRIDERRVRSPHAVHVLDTVDGRWLIKYTPPWISAVPADAHLVLQALDELTGTLEATNTETPARARHAR